jgi:hypothetical protein
VYSTAQAALALVMADGLWLMEWSIERQPSINHCHQQSAISHDAAKPT